MKETGQDKKKLFMKKNIYKKTKLKILGYVRSNNPRRMCEQIRTRVGNIFHSKGYPRSLYGATIAPNLVPS